MWEAFQRFSALDSSAQKLFGRAVVLLPWVKLSLHLRGFKKAKGILEGKLPAGSAAANPNPAQTVATVVRMVRAGGRWGMVRPNCLEESLVLWYLLQRAGIAASFRIGVRKSEGIFEAHAWVEYEGATLNQGEWTQPHYAAFESEFSTLAGEKQ